MPITDYAKHFEFLNRITAHPFTVDGHVGTWVYPQVSDLGNVFDVFHVCGIAPCSEYTRDFGSGVHIMRGDQCSGGIIDEGSECHRDLLGKYHRRWT